MIKQGYGTWKKCLYEHLVRANEVMLIRKLFGKEDAEKVYNEYYSNRKWIYLKGLVPLIEDFDGSGAKNKKIRNLMPQVIAYFNKESEHCQSH